MDVLFFVLAFALAVGPIATPAVAVADEVGDGPAGAKTGKIAVQIARKVAPDVAKTTLGLKSVIARWRMAPMGYATKIGTTTQQRKASEHSITSDGSKSKRGTASAPGMGAIGTAEAFVRRDIALVGSNGGQDDDAHGDCGRAVNGRIRGVHRWTSIWPADDQQAAFPLIPPSRSAYCPLEK